MLIITAENAVRTLFCLHSDSINIDLRRYSVRTITDISRKFKTINKMKIRSSIFLIRDFYLLYYISYADEKERIIMKSNKTLVPEAKAALDKFKMEAASEVGVNLKEGYNGDLTSRQAGSVGGQMVKKMIEKYENDIKASK